MDAINFNKCYKALLSLKLSNNYIKIINQMIDLNKSGVCRITFGKCILKMPLVISLFTPVNIFPWKFPITASLQEIFPCFHPHTTHTPLVQTYKENEWTKSTWMYVPWYLSYYKNECIRFFHFSGASILFHFTNFSLFARAQELANLRRQRQDIAN